MQMLILELSWKYEQSDRELYKNREGDEQRNFSASKKEGRPYLYTSRATGPWMILETSIHLQLGPDDPAVLELPSQQRSRSMILGRRANK